MKIRINGNSLRFRVSRTDIARLTDVGYLEEKTDFIGKSLFCALEIKKYGGLTASFSNNAIILYMPQSMLTDLDQNDNVGFENNYGKLHLQIEKDFVRLDKVENDQIENYPNPLSEKFYEQKY